MRFRAGEKLGTQHVEGRAPAGFLPPGTVGRLAGALYVVCGTLVLVVTPLLPAPPGSSLLGVEAVGAFAVVTGVVVGSLPWSRWSPTATLWLMPLAMAVVAAYNLATNVYGLHYPLFFMVIFVWLGVGHAPGTSLRFLPMTAAAYLAPLVVTDAPASALASVFYAVPTCGLIGETVAWVGNRVLRSERRFRALVQHATDVITVVGPDGRILYDSPAVERVLGYRAAERAGTLATDYICPEDLPILEAAKQEMAVATDGIAHVELRAVRADGDLRWGAMVIQDLRNDPAVGGIVANFRDITPERDAQERLRHQASHDELTGLPNRSLCVARIDALLRDRGTFPIAVLLLDLDRFKIVNDSLGHATGDLLLSTVARRLRAAVPGEQLVGRFGGDEFVVVLAGAGEEVATETAATLLAALSEPFTLVGKEVTVGASIGILVHEAGVSTADELLRDADAAMYAAKRAGGRAWQVFEDGMHAAAVEALDVETRLRRAIEDEQFELHYQPLVDLRTGSCRGAEALIRWRHPDAGLLGPGAFIGTAEDTGLIVEIGRWVLEEACAQLARWHATVDPDLEINVNLSARQLGDTSLVDTVEATLARTGLRPDRVVLEITESQVVEDIELASQRLRQLKDLGVRIAIDDFGTGHSSLGYLRTFPVDVLKLDRSFVQDMGTDRRAAQLVEAILSLGRALRLETVAEGIETAEQQRWLRALGCSVGQGYHLGRPVPAAQFAFPAVVVARD